MKLYKDDIDSHTNADLYFAHLGLLDMALRDLQAEQPQRAAQCLRRYVVLERDRRAHRCNDFYAGREKKLKQREQALKAQLQAAIEQLQERSAA